MLLLFETPAGFSLFKVKDEKKLDDVEVRVRNAIGGFLFRRPAARVNCGFYDSIRFLCASGLRGRGHVGVRESFVTAVCRTGIPAIAGFGGTVERFVRGRRIDSIAGKKEKRARARMERARTALCRSIGFGTRRLGFVRGVDVSRNVLLFD